MKSQTERIYEVLANIRPFALTANVIHFAVNDSTVENRGLPRIPKVSVNRALNELAKRGLEQPEVPALPPVVEGEVEDGE